MKEVQNIKLLFIRKLNNIESVAQSPEPRWIIHCGYPEGYVAVDPYR